MSAARSLTSPRGANPPGRACLHPPAFRHGTSGSLARIQDSRAVAAVPFRGDGRGPEGSRPDDEGQPQLAFRLPGLAQNVADAPPWQAHEPPLRAGRGSLRPARGFLAEPARSRIDRLLRPEGREAVPVGKVRTEVDRHLPSESRDLQGNPASDAGRANPRRGPTVPVQAACASTIDSCPRRGGCEALSGPRAAAPCCRRSEDQPGKDGGCRSFLETAGISDRGDRSPVPRAASSSNRSSPKRAAPPLSGAFTCRKMLAGIRQSDNIKLPLLGDFLCIVS